MAPAGCPQSTGAGTGAGAAGPEGAGWHLGATKPQQGLGGSGGTGTTLGTACHPVPPRQAAGRGRGAVCAPQHSSTMGAGEGMSLSIPAGWDTWSPGPDPALCFWGGGLPGKGGAPGASRCHRLPGPVPAQLRGCRRWIQGLEVVQ